MKRDEVMGRLENILFAAGEAMEIRTLADVLEVEEEQLRQWLDEEIARREAGYGLVLRRLEDRVQLATRPEEAPLLFSLFGEKAEEALTRAMLETLSIVAYRQPVTRAEIEELRGVNVSYILGVLVQKGLIREAGRKDAIGRPILYATTDGFLRHFGLESIAQLPKLPEV